MVAAVEGSCPKVVLILRVLLPERLIVIHLICLTALICNVLCNFVAPVPVPPSCDLTSLLTTLCMRLAVRLEFRRNKSYFSSIFRT
jgi:hypothetical protein